ncbi:MAG: precorrin-6A/cobalt-precorrin-6A reductase [Pseudomonadota bacterium]
MTRLLILGGTAEGRLLTERATVDLGCVVTLSLAGITQTPTLPAGVAVRRCGFGGVAGLTRWLFETGTEALICATHPFALQMPRHVFAAAGAANLPALRLLRPEWRPSPRDRWHVYTTLHAAIAGLPPGAHALLTTGSGMTELPRRTDLRMTLRTIEPPPEPISGIGLIVARPPFSQVAEVTLFRRLGITHLVTRNAGGGDRARLDAARILRLPVHMLGRPTPLEVPTVATVDAALGWLQTLGSKNAGTGPSPGAVP